MSEADWRHKLIALPSEKLRVGDALRFTLRDEQGRVLLAKGLRIEDRDDLDRLKARKRIFVEYEESDEAVKVLMQGLTETDKRDAPIGELDRYISLGISNGENGVRLDIPSDVAQAWGQLEQRLSGLLTTLGQFGPHGADALERLASQVVPMLDALLQHDRDAALCVLFHRSITGFTGYSAMHALQSAAVCHALSGPLKLSATEDAALVKAALTMNVAMKSLQDVLATQKVQLSPAQRTQIDWHPKEGVRLLKAAGVTDALWLDTVHKHHSEFPAGTPLANLEPADKLAKILQVVDRYTAALSPRMSRAGRDGKEATRAAVIQAGSTQKDEVGMALMVMLGLHPAGTFVRLASGETAVVLKKGFKPNEPLVATVLNKRDEPVLEPKVRNTASPEHAVVHGLSGSSVKVRLNLELLLKLMRSAKP